MHAEDIGAVVCAHYHDYALCAGSLFGVSPNECHRVCLCVDYLIVTIICEYKILRFWESDDFAGTKFCDLAKSS